MDDRATRHGGVTVTLISGYPNEEAQARIWRRIGDSWPRSLAPAGLHVAKFEEVENGERVMGAAALVVVQADEHQGAVFKVLDRLERDCVGAVVIFEEWHDRWRSLARQGVVAVSADEDPATIAAILAGMAQRQYSVEALYDELRVARRFQGGICGEMDKLHDELQLAASVQREFLPERLPQVDGVDFRVLFRPCGYVSGDIYDVQRLDEEHVGFFLADAVGHGVPAALMTMVLCKSLRTKDIIGDTYEIVRPGEVLSRMNAELIKRQGESPRFATAVYGVINAKTREVCMASAGHPPALRLSKRGVERVDAEGGLLGIFPDEQYEDQSFTLGEDEVLVAYSDGFETAFPAPNADEHGRRVPNMHYVDRFSEMARAWSDNGVSAAMRGFSKDLDQQTGSLHQLDDLTVMAVFPTMDCPVDKLFTGVAEGSIDAIDTSHEPRGSASADARSR